MAGDNQKKQVPLRLSPKLYAELAAWAEDEFRSVNGQIEYLLTECVRRRGRDKAREENRRQDGDEDGQADRI
ncbi:MAG: hypothetical protein IJG08_06600 [Oscillospiraceae bacterium]|nr:hypothetical protein [Oscillospiraceae bacterium]